MSRRLSMILVAAFMCYDLYSTFSWAQLPVQLLLHARKPLLMPLPKPKLQSECWLAD